METQRSNAISYGTSLLLYVCGFVLMLICYLGNRSWVSQLPKAWLKKTHADRYRTRATMNWTLFFFLLYQLGRIVATSLDIGGAFYVSHSTLKYISRVSTSLQVFLNQLLLVVISMLVVLWMNMTIIWFKGNETLEHVIRSCTLIVIVLVNLSNLGSSIAATVAQIMGPEMHPSFFHGAFFINVVTVYSACMGALALLTALLASYTLVKMHIQNQTTLKNDTFPRLKPKAWTHRWLGGDNQDVRQRIQCMIRMTISVLLVFVGMATRFIGFILVMTKQHSYLYSTFNNALPDLFVNMALLFVFWPFGIGSFLKPLTNIRSLNAENADAAIGPVDGANNPRVITPFQVTRRMTMALDNCNHAQDVWIDDVGKDILVTTTTSQNIVLPEPDLVQPESTQVLAIDQVVDTCIVACEDVMTTQDVSSTSSTEEGSPRDVHYPPATDWKLLQSIPAMELAIQLALDKKQAALNETVIVQMEDSTDMALAEE